MTRVAFMLFVNILVVQEAEDFATKKVSSDCFRYWVEINLGAFMVLIPISGRLNNIQIVGI